MATKSTTSVPFRRKREGKTDYRLRMRLLLGKQPRLVVRRSLKHLLVQMIEYHPEGDRVMASAHSRELAKFGWKANTNNLPACYLTGLLLARKVKRKLSCVLDLGHQPSIKGNSLYAAVQGAREGGLQVPCSPEMFPPPARVKGEHIVAWAKSAKAGAGKPFNACLARGWNPEQLSQQFEQVKKAILEAA